MDQNQGYKLSIRLVPYTTRHKIYNLKDWSEVHKILLDEAIYIRSGICADPFIAATFCMNFGRLTRSKMPIEKHILLATTGWTGFDEYIRQIRIKAQNQIDFGHGISLPEYPWTHHLCQNDESEWRLSTATDWVATFYDFLYVKKKIDWSKYFILFQVY